MQEVDPELLRNVRESPYRSAVDSGYRWLRFDPALEREFEIFYTDAHLVRVRLAGFLGIFLFAFFILIDISTLPAEVSRWTAIIRGGLVIPTYIVALVVSYRVAWRQHLRMAIWIASLITGLGTVAVIGAALSRGVRIPYEGILLVALFIYLIVCLQWWRAVLTNLITFVAFVAVEALWQQDAQARLYEVVFMFAANAVGAYGGYFLEYSTRTTFLVHALLHELAERDGLTGLFNRRTLNTHLDRLWRQANRDKHELVALAMIDVDHFKRYNDRYGHAQGDVALKVVAGVIQDLARRPLDLAARYGGEEFVLVWYNPLPAELESLGRRLTAGVLAQGVPHQDSEQGSLTVSVGIAYINPQGELSASELLKAADIALYQAKHDGRNRTVIVDAEAALDCQTQQKMKAN